ncbi:phytanoyl-CoA dioxygenase family protein [Bradyrhizobium sp. AUGA SZCCT0274]|uniref:phytanoyl-CoA dioxygenase family protein n=1 Tax=Bradyrhizobium sp. AUGA SZCCT0274 TaxID=2807670 RepID=UPI001BAC11CF|nr:phytanoyl-CoA dioxygenase family protein [Bradyrhizobium sp. AUGA SZCCT0274]MBR1240323.1 phytanoyl-CoA dioxygenase family protein [Bradyrhizobium sp. AUGA SZCCT0274]
MQSLSSAVFCGRPVGETSRNFEPLRETGAEATPDDLRGALRNQGYVFLRGLLPRETVERAREDILSVHAIMGEVDDRFPLSEGRTTDRSNRAGVNVRAARQAILRSEALRSVTRSAEVERVISALLEGPVCPWDFLWPRAMGKGSGTGLHLDAPFLRGPAPGSVISVWTPLGDIDPLQGGLVVLEGSQNCPLYKREYGDLDADADAGFGWYADRLDGISQPGCGPWRTTRYEMGDVLFFGLFMLHGALDNVTDFLRVSVDSRWQRSDAVIDPRWIGPAAYGRHPDRVFLPSVLVDDTLNEGLRSEFHWIGGDGRPVDGPPANPSPAI